MSLTSQTRRSLIGAAHALHPIVIIGNQGLSKGVLAETERALYDHELIKVRIPSEDKAEKRAMADELCRLVKAQCLRIIGNIIILYKPSNKKTKK